MLALPPPTIAIEAFERVKTGETTPDQALEIVCGLIDAHLDERGEVKNVTNAGWVANILFAELFPEDDWSRFILTIIVKGKRDPSIAEPGPYDLFRASSEFAGFLARSSAPRLFALGQQVCASSLINQVTCRRCGLNSDVVETGA